MFNFKKSLLALSLTMLLTVSGFAHQVSKSEATPQKQNNETKTLNINETKTLNIEVSGTFAGATFTQNYITIRCRGNEGCCFTLYNDELEIYERGSSSSYQVSSVLYTTIQGDETTYIISR